MSGIVRWLLGSVRSGQPGRLEALEHAVRKLSETQRDRSSVVNGELEKIARLLREAPTAKDLRELRQAVKALAPTADDRRLLDAVESLAASGRPIVVGPWTGEVGFELLYWIPFVEWARVHGGWSREREVIVSRGGVGGWYGSQAARYCDALALVAPEEFRSAIAAEKRKQRRPGGFDDRLVQEVVDALGLGEVDILHPGLMYRAFAPYWSDQAGFAAIDRFTRYRLLESPPPSARPGGLPPDYVAVRFYFNECFPPSAGNRAFARGVVTALAERTSVVLLNPGVSVDDHADWAPDPSDRVIGIAAGATPSENLALQSAVISGARAFVGTYGGYSYLAPLYGVPAVAFHSKQSFKQHHLYAAQRAFAEIGAASLVPLDVADAATVQLALGALVAA